MVWTRHRPSSRSGGLTPIGRREALRRLGGSAIALRALGASVPLAIAGCADSAAITMGPWPARPTARSMALWCESTAIELTARVLDEGGTQIAETAFEPAREGISLAHVTELAPDTEYRFEVSAEAMTHRGSFRTLPLEDGLVRIAIGSDIHPGSAPHVVFDRIRELSPHLYLGLGDQIYADAIEGPADATRESYEALYRSTWSDPSLRACWANVPALLMWDDHESWNDFDGSFDPVRGDVARAAHARFQRSRAPGDHAWTVLDAGPASIFVLDTRWFRSPNAQPDGVDKTMLGLEQREALFAWLAERRGRGVRIVASPTPLHRYADTGLDAWAHGFAYERGLVLDAIAANDPSTVLLVSGDHHWPGVFEHELGGASVLELMCTPVAAFLRPTPAPATLGPDVLFAGEGRGFGWLEIDGATSPPTVSFAWIDERGEERFSLVRP